jgi:RHS repeat-associated protein
LKTGLAQADGLGEHTPPACAPRRPAEGNSFLHPSDTPTEKWFAQYEYGPFGELLRATGPLAQTFNHLFSTKYFDWETGLSYYGHRYYSPTPARWLSRDPIAELGGLNVYLYVGNYPIGQTDIMGLWGTDVHYVATKRWAMAGLYPEQAAEMIAAADEAVDHGARNPITGDQSYHFNRNLRGGPDTRLVHFTNHLAAAKRLCTASLRNDFPEQAAVELGTGMHPLQDWVAHGDFGLAMHPRVWLVHNSMSPQHDFGRPGEYPDVTWLDAVGSSDGRPAGRAIRFIGSSNFDYAIYTPGIRRWKLTKEKTESALTDFRSHVKANGGCKCKAYFGVQ